MGGGAVAIVAPAGKMAEAVVLAREMVVACVLKPGKPRCHGWHWEGSEGRCQEHEEEEEEKHGLQ